MLFDTHAHYDDEHFKDDLHPLLESLPAKGVGYIITCACNLPQCEQAEKLADRYPFLYYSAGIHPLDCEEYDEKTIDAVARYAGGRKCVAIGEIGLDYHYRSDEKELQKKWFSRQLELAASVDLPVIVHDREAHADCFELLNSYRPRGVMHCFSGSAELAGEYVKRGFYIAFGGVITFSNAKKAIEAAKAVPMDRLLIETDCPYLAPVPYRGKRNDSSLVKYTCEKLAQIRGVTYEEMEKQTCDNAKTLFRID